MEPYRGYIGIMEKKMEPTIWGLYWGLCRVCIGLMENEMVPTILQGYRGDILEVVLALKRKGFVGFAGVCGPFSKCLWSSQIKSSKSIRWTPKP